MDEVLARLETWLREHRPEYLDSLLPGVPASDLAEAAAYIGIDDVGQLADLYAWRSGQPDDDCGGFWHILEFQTPEYMLGTAKIYVELREHGDFPPETWQSWLPFLNTNKGSVCVDYAGGFDGTRGQVLEFWGDGSNDVTILAPSLKDWLEVLVTGMERGLWTAEKGDLQPVEPEDRVDELHREMLPGYPREA